MAGTENLNYSSVRLKRYRHDTKLELLWVDLVKATSISWEHWVDRDVVVLSLAKLFLTRKVLLNSAPALITSSRFPPNFAGRCFVCNS